MEFSGKKKPERTVGKPKAEASKPPLAPVMRFAGQVEERDAAPAGTGLFRKHPWMRAADAFEAQADRVAARATAGTVVNGGGAGTSAPGGGPQPLVEEVRERVEPILGADLGHVRVHTDEGSRRTAAGIRAKAFTHGSDIYLGPRQSPTDLGLLAHEATHVVQQGAAAPLPGRQAAVAARPAAAPAVQRQEDEEQGTPVVFDFGTTIPPEIQDRYPFLMQALTPEERHGLEIAFTSLAIAPLPSEEGVAQRGGQISVPLSRILAPNAHFVDRDPWEGVFALLRAHANPMLVGAMLQNEIVRRFFERNGLTPESTVVIQVVQGQAPGGNARLDFQVTGRTVTNTQGALAPTDLDAIHVVRLQEIIDEVSREAENVGLAAALLEDLADQDRRITAIHSRTREGFEDYSLRRLQGRLGALRENRRSAERLSRGGPVPAAAEGLAGRYDPLIARMDALITEGQVWHIAHQPMITQGEAVEEAGVAIVGEAGRQWDEGGLGYAAGGALYAGGFLVAMFDGLGNLLSFGYQNAERDSTQAFRRGDISWNEMEEFQDAAFTRALIVGIVTVAVTIATAGVGASVAGGLGLASGSLGASMVGGGVEAGIVTFSSMTTETLVTDARTMSNPTTQQLWMQGHHTPGQIALGTALGGGLGAGGGALGYYARASTALTTRQGTATSQEFVVGEYTILLDATPGQAPLAVGSHAADPALVFFARREGAGFYRIGASGEYIPLREVGRGGVNATQQAQQLLAVEATAAGQPGSSLVRMTPTLTEQPGAYVVSQEGGIIAFLPIAGEGAGQATPQLLGGVAREGLPRLGGLSSGQLVGGRGTPPLVLGGEASASGLPDLLTGMPGQGAMEPLVFIALPPPPDPQVVARDMVAQFLEAAPVEGAPSESAIDDLISGFQRSLPPPPPPQLDLSLSFMEPRSQFLDLTTRDPLAPIRNPLSPLGFDIPPPSQLVPLIEPPPQVWRQRASGLLVPQSQVSRIRTINPATGNVEGWGGFDISTSMMWSPARFSPADRQAMETIADRIADVPQLNPQRWAAGAGQAGFLNQAARERALRRAVTATLDTLGVPRSRRPNVTFYVGPAGDYGWTSWQFNQLANGRLRPQTQRGEIAINVSLSVGDAVGTAVHEARHYYQIYQAYQQSLGRQAHPSAATWSTNLPQTGGTYQTTGPGYFTQPIERDAESFGRRTLDELPSPSRWPSQ